MHGGEVVAKALAKQNVPFVFTLVGGHISPILSACKHHGIRVIDVRHEVNAVFAADAVSRLSGVPGVAAVTAGPGLTNTVTAVKNASMAQSALVLIGGAAPTVLKGRGALQDIDQMALLRPHVKWAKAIRRMNQLVPAIEEAFFHAMEGVPGPVFLECPIDVLYEEKLVREWYGAAGGKKARNFGEKALNWYLKWHVDRMFKGSHNLRDAQEILDTPIPRHNQSDLKKVASALKKAHKPVFLIGSQTVLQTGRVEEIREAISSLGVPVYLSGMARGLLGADHPLQSKHKRRNALKEADLVLLAGVPCDFRLDYGRHLSGRAMHIGVNRSREDLRKNKKPKIGVLADPGLFLIDLARHFQADKDRLAPWFDALQERNQAREEDIDSRARQEVEGINPLRLFRELDPMLADNSILVADGGDFVATGSYTLKPRNPLSWLDPGAFGTLGVGAGFALGAKLCRPEAEVWIIYGDGSSAYSLAEFDTFKRHDVPVIGLVGNDACWAQIARDQVEILKDDVACMLSHSDYEVVVRGYGGEGTKVEHIGQFREAVAEAKKAVQNKQPFLINAIIGKTDFRKGSISM